MCDATNNDPTQLLAYSIYNSLYNSISNNRLISYIKGIISSDKVLNDF